MATLSPSSIMYGASGLVGGLIFRQINGKTVVSAYHSPRPKRTELQRVFNDKMRLAAWHARAAMLNPATRAHYEKKKKRLNVSSAYTAACTDFLRHGKIEMIDTSKYDKGIIKIKAYKADLGFEEVTVKLNSKKGLLVKARAIEGSQGQWVSAPTYPYRPSTT
jgi:metal-dependent hydrolase (beta-lactamase superfamily II)